METYQAEHLFRVLNALGEGPLWHPVEKRLYWTDILTGTLYRTNTDLTILEKTFLDIQVGAFAFRKNGGMILASDHGFMEWFFEDHQIAYLWNPLIGQMGVRLNDGKVDPAGRFWAGSLDFQHQKAKLYRLDPDGEHHTMLTGIGISNGIGWSPDHKRMYYTDSYQSTIYVFDYDLESGDITNQKPFVVLPKDEREIVPDGLCVDAEGYIWSAQWNGWGITRYNPQGGAVAHVEVPAQRVTSCCFGGENLDRLLITTSRADLSEDALSNQPYAGDVFVCKVPVQGQETNLFG